MSSGKVDTSRCHPLWFFFSAWVFQTALKRKEKKKAAALVLCVPAEVSEIDQRSAPWCCISSWLIELSGVGNSHPPCVYTPVAPCQQLSASIRPHKQHHDARFMALITRSCMKQVRRTPSPRYARLSQTHTRSLSWLPGLFRGTKKVFKEIQMRTFCENKLSHSCLWAFSAVLRERRHLVSLQTDGETLGSCFHSSSFSSTT